MGAADLAEAIIQHTNETLLLVNTDEHTPPYAILFIFAACILGGL